MTKEEFVQRFIETTNGLRRALGDRPITALDLVRSNVEATACVCGDPTCPGWAMKFDENKVPPQPEDRIILSHQQARDIVEAFGGDDDSIIQVTRVVEGGHSGPGLYCHEVEYPDEGSTYLGPEP